MKNYEYQANRLFNLAEVLNNDPNNFQVQYYLIYFCELFQLPPDDTFGVIWSEDNLPIFGDFFVADEELGTGNFEYFKTDYDERDGVLPETLVIDPETPLLVRVFKK